MNNFLFFLGFLIFSCSGEMVDQELQAEIDAINSNTPFKVDDITTLTSVNMIGDNIIYEYEVETYQEEEFFQSFEFKRLQRESLIDMYCYNLDLQLFRDYNKRMTYKYYSNLGFFLAEIDVSLLDCQ